MHDLSEQRKEIVEPPQEDIDYCSICDCEISVPDAPDHLCAHCRADEVAT